MSRKTFEITQLIEWVNTRLATPSSSFKLPDGMTAEQAYRLGMESLLEQVLHHTGTYAGFNYQESELKPEADRDYDDPKVSILRDGYDDTRRIYYRHHRL